MPWSQQLAGGSCWGTHHESLVPFRRLGICEGGDRTSQIPFQSCQNMVSSGHLFLSVEVQGLFALVLVRGQKRSGDRLPRLSTCSASRDGRWHSHIAADLLWSCREAYTLFLLPNTFIGHVPDLWDNFDSCFYSVWGEIPKHRIGVKFWQKEVDGFTMCCVVFS